MTLGHAIIPSISIKCIWVGKRFFGNPFLCDFSHGEMGYVANGSINNKMYQKRHRMTIVMKG
jgi:hypothetical protein